MKKFFRRLNQKGFSHHLIVPAIVVVVVGAIGAYILVKSHAAPLTPEQQQTLNSGQTFQDGTKLGSAVSPATTTGCTDLGIVQVTVHEPSGSSEPIPEKYHQTLSQPGKGGQSSGDCVKAAQGLINQRFCSTPTELPVDGQYGPKTAHAVTVIQNAANTGIRTTYSHLTLTVNGNPIGVDGILGPQTWGILHVITLGPPQLSCS